MKYDYEIRGNYVIIFRPIKSNGLIQLLKILIDKDDLDLVLKNVSSIKINDSSRTKYASYLCKEDKKNKMLHRLIMNTPKHLQVDHINFNGLDNRKENLRNCTYAENAQNRQLRKGNDTGVRGVYFNPLNNKYKATCRYDGKQNILGYFKTLEEAAEVVKEFRKKHMPFSTN